MIVLGIETSCDETAAAVVRDGREVLSNVIYSQIAKHRPYGGVVPEIACRVHVEALPGVLAEAVETAGTRSNASPSRAAPDSPVRCWSASRPPKPCRSGSASRWSA